MSMMKEFKEFAMRGSVVDLAVGVVIGAAFGKIVSSMVADLIMPIIGLLVGGMDFSDLALTLKPAVGDQPAVLFAYGSFVQAVFNFVIIAFAIFAVVRGINRMKRKEEAKPSAPPTPPEPSAEQKLLVEIRDLLKQR